MAIWCTDSNGQLGRDNQDNKNKHIIGQYKYAKETEKENVQRLYNTCKTYNIIPMNTWESPQLTTGGNTPKKPTQPGTHAQKLVKVQNKNNYMYKPKQQNK